MGGIEGGFWDSYFICEVPAAIPLDLIKESLIQSVLSLANREMSLSEDGDARNIMIRKKFYVEMIMRGKPCDVHRSYAFFVPSCLIESFEDIIFKLNIKYLRNSKSGRRSLDAFLLKLIVLPRNQHYEITAYIQHIKGILLTTPFELSRILKARIIEKIRNHIRF